MYRLLRCSNSPGPGWANRTLRLVVLFCSRLVSRLGVMIRRNFFRTFCMNIRSISLEDTAVKGLLAMGGNLRMTSTKCLELDPPIPYRSF